MDTSLINHQSHTPCHSFLMMFLIQEGYDNHRLNRQASPQGSCDRSSHPEMFLRKGVLEICSKFTGEHTCQSAISIKLLCNFIEITLWHGCSTVNLLHIFRTSFLKNTSGRLLLELKYIRQCI